MSSGFEYITGFDSAPEISVASPLGDEVTEDEVTEDEVLYVQLASGELFAYTQADAYQFAAVISDALSSAIDAYGSKMLTWIMDTHDVPPHVPTVGQSGPMCEWDLYLKSFVDFECRQFMTVSMQQLDYYKEMSWIQQQWCHTVAGLLDEQLYEAQRVVTKIFVYNYIALRYRLSHELLCLIENFSDMIEQVEEQW